MADTQNVLEKVAASSPASRTHSAGAQLQAALADHRVGAPMHQTACHRESLV